MIKKISFSSVLNFPFFPFSFSVFLFFNFFLPFFFLFFLLFFFLQHLIPTAETELPHTLSASKQPIPVTVEQKPKAVGKPMAEEETDGWATTDG